MKVGTVIKKVLLSVGQSPGIGWLEAPGHFSILGIRVLLVFLIPEAAPRTKPWDDGVVSGTPVVYKGLNPVKASLYINFKDAPGRYGDPFLLLQPKINLLHQFPYLLKRLPPSISPSPAHTRGQLHLIFRISQEGCELTPSERHLTSFSTFLLLEH